MRLASRCTSRVSGTSTTEGYFAAVSAQILDGKATAAAVKADLKERVAALAARGVVPGLGTILVGDDPGVALLRGGQAPGLRAGGHRLDPP